MTKLLLMLAFVAPSALGDTLVKGATYFDSENTLSEVVQLSLRRDNDAIATLIKYNHVSEKTAQDLEVVVLTSGSQPESPAEFRFLNNPTTYWTVSKYITNIHVAASPSPTPPQTAPIPTPTVTPNPTSAVPHTPSRKVLAEPAPVHHRHPSEEDKPPDNDSQKVWHKVNGRWKWYDRHPTPNVRRAEPVGP